MTLSFLATLFATPAALAQKPNLVLNPAFATDLSAWDSLFVLTDHKWSSLDSNGASNSGSALLNQSPANTNGISSLRQCFGGVVPGRLYNWGGKVRIPSGSEHERGISGPRGTQRERFRSEEYRWGSYRWLASFEKPPDWFKPGRTALPGALQ